MNLQTPALLRLIDSWIDEDIGRGDLSSIALQENNVSASWIAKSSGIFCGGFIIETLFKRLDKFTQVNLLIKDGERFISGQKILILEGSPKSLVAIERTALNITMHLSGIATATYSMVNELKGTGVRLVDTRKTTPGLRVLEKYATRCGGGLNHRMGLDDAIMLKENHLAWSKNLESAISKIRGIAPWTAKIIVEAEKAQQAIEGVQAGADGILLDEIPHQTLKDLVPELRHLAQKRSKRNLPSTIILEASGILPAQLKEYASTGVDLISSSAPITKSSWVDFSMRFEVN